MQCLFGIKPLLGCDLMSGDLLPACLIAFHSGKLQGGGQCPLRAMERRMQWVRGSDAFS